MTNIEHGKEVFDVGEFFHKITEDPVRLEQLQRTGLTKYLSELLGFPRNSRIESAEIRPEVNKVVVKYNYPVKE